MPTKRKKRHSPQNQGIASGIQPQPPLKVKGRVGTDAAHDETSGSEERLIHKGAYSKSEKRLS
jgi:hypothetical protein